MQLFWLKIPFANLQSQIKNIESDIAYCKEQIRTLSNNGLLYESELARHRVRCADLKRNLLVPRAKISFYESLIAGEAQVIESRNQSSFARQDDMIFYDEVWFRVGQNSRISIARKFLKLA